LDEFMMLPNYKSDNTSLLALYSIISGALFEL